MTILAVFTALAIGLAEGIPLGKQGKWKELAVMSTLLEQSRNDQRKREFFFNNTKSCKFFVDYAFGQLKLIKVEIRCAEKNNSSRVILERLGFVREGMIREAEGLYNHYVDHVVYGMLAAEWGIKSVTPFTASQPK